MDTEEIKTIVDNQKKYFLEGHTLNLKYRISN